MNEQRRHVDAFGAEQPHVRRLERRRGDQPIAEAQPDPVVLARVLVGDRVDLARGDGPARMRHQRVVQGELGGARIRHGRELGAREVAPQERVGDREAPVAAAREQPEPGG